MPTHYEDGIASYEFPDSPMPYYHQLYYEAIDTTVSCLKDCFEQPCYQTYSNLEQLLIEACQGKEFVEELDLVCHFYKEDLQKDLLHCKPLTLIFNQNLKSFVVPESQRLHALQSLTLKNIFNHRQVIRKIY